MLNRATLAAVFADGIARVRSDYANQGAVSGYGDIKTSCVLLEREIKLESIDRLLGWGLVSEKAYRHIAKTERPMTYHYSNPPLMYGLHALLGHAPGADESELARQAFPTAAAVGTTRAIRCSTTNAGPRNSRCPRWPSCSRP